MDTPPELDDCIEESIDQPLALSYLERTLESKLRASEEIQRRLEFERSLLLSKLKEKDRAIDLATAESGISARALKRFAEENQKLAVECTNLVSEGRRLERECSLYDKDREALMDFANEAQQMANEGETRVHTLEEEVLRYKRELISFNKGGIAESMEENLLESVLGMLVDKDACASATSFLESYGGHESCRKLLRMENHLRPATRKILSLAAEVERVLKDKQDLRMNLHRAEEEVKLLFEDNNFLDEENKMFARFYHHGIGSSGSRGSTETSKSNKRKSNQKMYTPIEKRSDLNDVDSGSWTHCGLYTVQVMVYYIDQTNSSSSIVCLVLCCIWR